MELLFTTINYVIKLKGDIYYKEHPSGRHWTQEREQAKKFMFATSAVTFATFKLDLSPVDYTVEML